MAKIITKNGIFSSSAGVEFQTGASSSLFVSSSGVGIGTNNPSASLDIESGQVLLPEGIEPSLPPVGKGYLYADGLDSHIYWKNDLGDVFDLTDTSTVSGATGVNIRDEGVELPNSPYDTLNFIGEEVSASDAGGGVANITVSPNLRKLLYFVNEGPVEGYTGSYKEVAGGIFPSSVIWYTDSGKSKKIVEKTISYAVSGNVFPTPIVWNLYDEDGSTILVTVTDDIYYVGVSELSRERTISSSV